MSVLLYILIAVAILILGLIVFVATRPADFRLERTADINASSDVVFPLVNNLHEWQRWSPFEKLDPNMKKTFEGPDAGPGAISAWEGNSKAGAGRMTVTESHPNESLKIKLEFFKPFACTNTAIFTFVPIASGTKVTWAMEGKNNFMAKAFHLMIDMDGMVGKDFAEGLQNLNRIAQERK